MYRKLLEHSAWLWIVLSGATVSAVVFAVWEVIQRSVSAGYWEPLRRGHGLEMRFTLKPKTNTHVSRGHQESRGRPE